MAWHCCCIQWKCGLVHEDVLFTAASWETALSPMKPHTNINWMLIHSEHLCTSWLHGWSGSHKFWVLSPFTYHRTNPHHPSTRWMKTLWSELVHASCYIAQFKCVHNTAVSIQSAICAGSHTHVNQPVSRKRGNLMVWLGKHALKVCSKSPPEISSPKFMMISRMQKATIRWGFEM